MPQETSEKLLLTKVQMFKKPIVYVFLAALLVMTAMPAFGHGPTPPPDPWELKHGPTPPPDPWELKIAHGPTPPPDPWEARVA